MRKTMLLGFGLAAVVASVAAAQAPGDTSRRPRGDGDRPGQFERRGGGPEGLLLRGITLTETQKTQLKQLRESEHQRMRGQRDSGEGRKTGVGQPRQRGDTAAVRAAMQQRRQVMQQERERHVVAVRNVLTAEQRVQFDKNVAELKQRQARRGEGFGPGGRGGKVGKGGAKVRR